MARTRGAPLGEAVGFASAGGVVDVSAGQKRFATREMSAHFCVVAGRCQSLLQLDNPPFGPLELRALR